MELLIVVASALVLVVYGANDSFEESNGNVLLFYGNTLSNEHKDPKTKFHRKYDGELRGKENNETRIYIANHTEPYEIPDAISFRTEKQGICEVSRCTYTCKNLNYKESYCVSTTLCLCGKFQDCLNCSRNLNKKKQRMEFVNSIRHRIIS